MLRAAAKYYSRTVGIPLQPAIVLPPKEQPRERWLTRQEAARLLKAARPFPHLARFILLGLATGSRPKNLFALRWDQIDLVAGIMRRRGYGEREQSRKRAAGSTRLENSRSPKALAPARPARDARRALEWPADRSLLELVADRARSGWARRRRCHAAHVAAHKGDVAAAKGHRCVASEWTLGDDAHDTPTSLRTPRGGLSERGGRCLKLCRT